MTQATLGTGLLSIQSRSVRETTRSLCRSPCPLPPNNRKPAERWQPCPGQALRHHLETLGPCLALSPALSPAPYPCLATQSPKKEVVSGVSRQPGPRGRPHPQAISLPGPPTVSFQGARARRVVRAMRTRERRCEPLRMGGQGGQTSASGSKHVQAGARASEDGYKQAGAGMGKGGWVRAR